MSVTDTINLIFREFKRYTGDGQPGAPSGAPLPVGDPQSGPYSPKKSELRAAFGAILGAGEAAAEAAADALAELERLYLGAKAADPSTDNEGNPLQTGALYFNTASGKFRVWNAAWQDQSLALSDGAVTNAKLAAMAQATVKGRAAGAGLGAAGDLTAAQLYAILQSVTGVLHVQDRKVAANGGNFATGAWRTRDLNTSLVNTITGASLNAATGEITLPAGNYVISGGCSAFAVNRNKARLFNVTTGLAVVPSMNAYASSAGGATSIAQFAGEFTLSATSVLRIEHNCETTNGAGFGLSCSSQGGEVDIYSDITIGRVP